MDETGAKITALDPLTDGASDDLLAIVDVSDNNVGEGAMSADGTNKKMTLANLANSLDALGIIIPKDGWTTFLETVTYSSVDDPTGVVTISGDYSGYFSEGMRIKFDNGGNTIYGIITVVDYTAPNTTITFLHEIDPTDSQALTLMANSAITNFYYSAMKAPQGFPLDPLKWSVTVTDTTSRSSTPAQNVWTNIGTTNSQISVPIGVWDLSYLVRFASASAWDCFVTLATVNNDYTDGEFNFALRISDATAYMQTASRRKIVSVTSKTTYYLNAVNITPVSSVLYFFGSAKAPTIIRATCAYL